MCSSITGTATGVTTLGNDKYNWLKIWDLNIPCSVGIGSGETVVLTGSSSKNFK